MLSYVSKPLSGAAIGVVAALVLVAPAHALPVNVTYSMSYSIVAPAAGVPVLYGPGSLTVQFSNGTGTVSGTVGHVGAGALHVVSGTAMLSNTFSALGGVLMFTGMQNVVFAGSGVGTATAAGLFNLATIGHIASGMVHCSGGFCGLAMTPGGGAFVTSVPVNLTTGMRTINLNNPLNSLVGFPSVGPQTFMAMGTGGMTPNGGIFAVTANGTEVGRHVVPEPSTGLLLGLGLVGFGIAMTTWRARRGRA